MPKSLVWTAAQDAAITRMRAEGATWATIGEHLGLSRNTVIERGRRIHAAQGSIRQPAQREPERPREPLPAGHPETWRLISKEPYPGGAYSGQQ